MYQTNNYLMYISNEWKHCRN